MYVCIPTFMIYVIEPKQVSMHVQFINDVGTLMTTFEVTAVRFWPILLAPCLRGWNSQITHALEDIV